MYTSLKERTQRHLEKTEANLQSLTSFFESTKSKYKDVINHFRTSGVEFDPFRDNSFPSPTRDIFC